MRSGGRRWSENRFRASSRPGQVHDAKEIGLEPGAEVLNARVLDQPCLCHGIPVPAKKTSYVLALLNSSLRTDRLTCDTAGADFCFGGAARSHAVLIEARL